MCASAQANRTQIGNSTGMQLNRTFTDKASGKDVKRPQLEALLGFVRDVDVFFVHSMDRLARNLDDLRRIVKDLTGRGVRIEFVKEVLCSPGMIHQWLHCFSACWVLSQNLNDLLSKSGKKRGLPWQRLVLFSLNSYH